MSKIENDFAPSTDFLKILPDLWNGRKLILMSIVAAAVASAIAAFLMPVTFESEIGLILMPPPFKDSKDEMTQLMPKVLGVPDFEILLHSDGVLMEAVQKVKEEAKTTKKDIWPDQDDIDALDEVSSMRRRLFVTTDISEKNVTNMKYSPVIRLTARAKTAEQAQHLAQAWGEVSEELARTIYTKGKTGIQEFMRSEFEDSREMLMDISRQIRDVEIDYNDEAERTRLSKKQERLLTYEEKLTDNAIKLATLEKELSEMQASFEAQPKFIKLWKSPPMDAVFLGEQLEKKSLGKAPQAGDENKQYGFEEEVLNGIHTELETQIITKKSEIASLVEFRSQMQSALDQLTTDLQDLRREVAVRTYERKMLDLQMTPAKSAYEAFSVKLQQAKVAESEQANLADIKIIAEAVIPDKKSWPPRSVIVIAGAFLAAIFSTAFLVIRGYLQRAGALQGA